MKTSPGKIRTLSLDLETCSSAELPKTGVYRYAEAPDFTILLLGYSADGGEVRVVDLACGEPVPEEILDAITDPDCIKWAFNASFERVCLSAWLRKHYPERFKGYGDPEDSTTAYLDPSSWRCSMVWCAYTGLPLSLAEAGAALKLDQQKLSAGRDLIRYFCMPQRSRSREPSLFDGKPTRHLPQDAPEKWELFKSYNKRDVEVELAIQQRLRRHPVPDFVWEQYHLDQRINDRGIAVDLPLVESAIALDEQVREELTERLKRLTGLRNPNSVQQLKDWLAGNGILTDTLAKKAVANLMETADGPLKQVLRCRQQLSRSSIKKYTAMRDAVCADGRARGMFQFYGAPRSGRWSGRLVQLQNLPQNHLPDLEEARALVRERNYDAVTMLYDNVPDTLSQLIRTAFIPKKGYKFIVSDFAAIEARVLAYLAGEQWRLVVFSEGGDIYCASASQMFGVPVVKHGVNGHLRQKGKISELALGYGGSTGALRSMGALELGMQEEELQPLVDSWRGANPKITQFWWDVDAAAKKAVQLREETEANGIRFSYTSGILFIELPSGRRLSYVKPRIEEGDHGPCITYDGTGRDRSGRVETYGAKLVENITQAVARDILTFAMQNLRDCRIVAHVHDEVILEAPEAVTVQEVTERMGQTPPWMPGLPLRADGYECGFYRKD